MARPNCLVWKLFSLNYSDNDALSIDEDRRIVDEAVEIDAALHERHANGIELDGVYRVR